MNPILISFLCGAAFIGGAVATTLLVVMARSWASKKDRDELYSYWRASIEKHGEQVAILNRIAETIENRKGN